LNLPKNICILVLAYNVENYIEKVINELLDLELQIFVIDDKSKDNTKNILQSINNKSNKSIEIIENRKNIGAGESLKKLITLAKKSKFDFFIKVDGDGQFLIEDVKKIYDISKKQEFDFIKSNRFWSDGIIGKIPFHRLVGNLIATLMMQVSTGTSMLFDPLNGLFGGKTDLVNYLDSRMYPKRYGYPFFFSVVSTNNYLKICQLNNTIKYADEKSNLKTLRVFFILMRITISSYFIKIKFKITKDLLQFSAFLDIVFIMFFVLFLYTIGKTFSYHFISFNDGNQGQWLILSVAFLFSSIFCFIKSFNIESVFKNENISTL
tara:strand:- start:1813 stop:2775 length:963 start_codon:yes stop_codon:yes gene_type:complete